MTLRFYFKACQTKRIKLRVKDIPRSAVEQCNTKNKNNKERGSREMTAHVAVNARQCQLSVRERSSAAKKNTNV